MNTILLNIIKEQILAEPRQFNMNDWFSDDLPDGSTPANCGTAACIAGWAIAKAVVVNPANAEVMIMDNGMPEFIHAAMLLGLSSNQALLLFHEKNWPKQFQSTDRAGLKLRAKRAAARIDHFIKTKGRE